MAGFTTRLLFADLSRGLLGEEKLPAQWYQANIGGAGVGLEYLLEDLKLRKPILNDPIIIMTGPLTGLPFPAVAKASIISYVKSDRSLILNSLEGRFPAYIKYAGYDGLVITGEAKVPVQLCIEHEQSRIVDASQLWGKDIFEAEEAIKKDRGDVSTLVIGTPGEEESAFASVVSDRFINLSPGIGRSFGSKKLKAISADRRGKIALDENAKACLLVGKRLSNRFFRTFPEDQLRRSCFGCPCNCGVVTQNGNRIYFQSDLELIQDILPTCSKESILKLHDGFLNQGLDIIPTTHALRSLLENGRVDDIIHDLSNLIEQAQGEQFEEPHLPKVQLNLHGGYLDVEFSSIRSIRELVAKEDLVMAKNCLPLCRRWEIQPGDLVECLNQIAGFQYDPESIVEIGASIIKRLGNLVGIGDEIKSTPQDQIVNSPILPTVLRKNWEEYLEMRGYVQT